MNPRIRRCGSEDHEKRGTRITLELHVCKRPTLPSGVHALFPPGCTGAVYLLRRCSLDIDGNTYFGNNTATTGGELQLRLNSSRECTIQMHAPMGVLLSAFILHTPPCCGKGNARIRNSDTFFSRCPVSAVRAFLPAAQFRKFVQVCISVTSW